ncbi:four helix bundle protein [Promineifilum sp.]|uniref:four helix bundle protein n=1 Tax=Promineifilum sp. TaxID=2664178 RepID=UPI0035AE6176
MTQVSSYRDLVVWQKAMTLAEEVYRLSESFPSREQYGLTSQLRRAAVSVAANLAEGHSRATRKDYNHFVSIAMGSLAEVETYLILAGRLKLADKEVLTPLWHLAQEVSKMLTALHHRLQEQGPGSREERSSLEPGT